MTVRSPCSPLIRPVYLRNRILSRLSTLVIYPLQQIKTAGNKRKNLHLRNTRPQRTNYRTNCPHTHTLKSMSFCLASIRSGLGNLRYNRHCAGETSPRFRRLNIKQSGNKRQQHGHIPTVENRQRAA